MGLVVVHTVGNHTNPGSRGPQGNLVHLVTGWLLAARGCCRVTDDGSGWAFSLVTFQALRSAKKFLSGLALLVWVEGKLLSFFLDARNYIIFFFGKTVPSKWKQRLTSFGLTVWPFTESKTPVDNISTVRKQDTRMSLPQIKCFLVLFIAVHPIRG